MAAATANNYSVTTSVYNSDEITPQVGGIFDVIEPWDETMLFGNNSNWLTDYDFESLFYHHSFRMWTYIVTSFCIVSFVCSALFTVITLGDQSMKATLRPIYVAMTANDAVLLCFYALTQGPLRMNFNTVYTAYFRIVGSTCFTVLLDVAVWLLVAVVVHQYLDVLKKHVLLRHVTPFRVRLSLVVLYAACILYRVPYIFETEVERVFGRIYVLNYSELAHTKPYLIFRIFCIVTLELILPFTLLVYFIVQIKRSGVCSQSNHGVAGIGWNQSTQLPRFSFDSKINPLTVTMAVAGCVCLPINPLLHLHALTYPLGYFYYFEYEEAILHVMVILLLMYPAIKLFIYVAITNRRGIDCSCNRSRGRSTSSFNVDHVNGTGGSDQRPADVVIFAINDDNCALVTLDMLDQAK